jgi:hypothetical protein
MLRAHGVLSIVILLAAGGVVTGRGPVSAQETTAAPTVRKLALSLHAGPHDRENVFVSALIDSGKAQSVFVEYADGTLGRAQLLDPGLLNAAARGTGKKELHFVAPKMARGETATVLAAISEQPIEGRTYVWSGEPRQSRRLSCGQCHQGLALPTGGELRREQELLATTGQVPPLELPRILPTSKGRDSRWHEKLGRFQSSACWECHARHMVQYEFGQSLDRELPWAPDSPLAAKATEVPAVRNVFHTVFRVREGRAVSHPLASGNAAEDRPGAWKIQYGFERATMGSEPCADLLQQHVGTLSEEAGKFIGRHNVRIHWVGHLGQKRTVIAREERQLTVKDFRGVNKSYAMWIDFASTLHPAAGAFRLDAAGSPAGFRFVPSIDADTAVEHREAAAWRAITFISEGTTYTAVCVNHPSNPVSLGPSVPRAGAAEPVVHSGGVPEIGYSFSAECAAQKPLLVHYRLWIQGGNMPTEEIQSLSNGFLESIQIEGK